MTEIKSFYKPECLLIGEDGNVFYIIGKVVRTLKGFGLVKEAEEFQHKAMNECKSYNEVLQLVSEYVEIV